MVLLGPTFRTIRTNRTTAPDQTEISNECKQIRTRTRNTWSYLVLLGPTFRTTLTTVWSCCQLLSELSERRTRTRTTWSYLVLLFGQLGQLGQQRKSWSYWSYFGPTGKKGLWLQWEWQKRTGTILVLLGPSFRTTRTTRTTTPDQTEISNEHMKSRTRTRTTWSYLVLLFGQL